MSGLQGPSSARPRWLAVAALAVLLAAGATATAVLLTGASDSEPPRAASAPRPVTAAEADRLAVMRFQNYRATGAHVRTRVSSAREPLRLEGDVDYRRELGYANVAGAGSSFTLQWNATTLLAWPGAGRGSTPPAKPPRAKPVSRALAPTQSTVDAVLAVLLGLGADRPDNAQLIRRNGARWLRSETIGDTRVDVMQGPAATGGSEGSGALATYWLDASGHLLRLEALLGGGSDATRIDLDAASFQAFPRSSRLAG